MTSPTPDFLTRLTRVVETLDPVPSSSETLRERLIQSATEVCDQQQIPVTTAQIAEAVDQDLAGALEPCSTAAPDRAAPRSAYDFGWARPKGENHRQRALRWAKTLRPLAWIGLNIPRHPGPTIPFTLLIIGSMFYLNHLLPLDGQRPLDALIMMAILIFGSLGGCFGLGCLAYRWGLNHDRREQRLQTAIPTRWEIEEWQATPELRDYVRQCLLSGLPHVLEGDRHRLNEMQLARAQARKEDEAAQKQAGSLHALRQAFLTQDEAVDHEPTRPSSRHEQDPRCSQRWVDPGVLKPAP